MSKARSSALILTVLMLALVLFGCSGKNKADVITVKNSETAEPLSVQSGNKSVYVSAPSSKQLKKIITSGISSLYIDEKTYAVSVYDSISKKMWASLPEKYTNECPAAVSVDVMADGNVYTLNSQDDSVAKGTATYAVKDSSLTVTYIMKRTLKDGTCIHLNIPVVYTAQSGGFGVSVDCSKIRGSEMSENAVIKTLHLLEYFGSDTGAGKGDYIFVPDGCGAIISTYSVADKFDKITLPVYGADYAAGENSKVVCAAAVFGMKKGESAYTAIIENGDALAKITAERALKSGAYNRVGACFDITKMLTDKEKGVTYAASDSYDGNISITYRLLSGDNANYTGMAGACREALIGNGVMNFESSVEAAEGLPFVLNLIGAAEISNPDGKAKTVSLTSFEQANEVLSLIRGKGISNIYLRYRGILDGGLRQTAASKADISSALGSQSSFNELISYTDAQNIQVYADVNLLSAKSGSLGNTAADLTSSPVQFETNGLSNDTFESDLLAASSAEKTTNSVLSKMRSLNIDGVCFADAGKVLYSDFSDGNGLGRQQMKEKVSSLVGSVSASKKLMVDCANIYSIKYSDIAVNLPTDASISKRGGCRAVPFLQILLHGTNIYSCEPINLEENSETAMLKAAEYGCAPCYELYYEDRGDEKQSDSYNYMNCASDAQLCHERMNKVFSDLNGKKITAHYQVRSGVYCTRYGSDTSVYVNYNNKEVTVGGVTIEARDFLRVN